MKKIIKKRILPVSYTHLDIAELREIMSYDEMELDMVGDQRTALFIIISDTDDTFNFVVAMMYSQLFNLLCDKMCIRDSSVMCPPQLIVYSRPNRDLVREHIQSIRLGMAKHWLKYATMAQKRCV